jgi:hypothetical protein
MEKNFISTYKRDILNEADVLNSQFIYSAWQANRS